MDDDNPWADLPAASGKPTVTHEQNHKVETKENEISISVAHQTKQADDQTETTEEEFTDWNSSSSPMETQTAIRIDFEDDFGDFVGGPTDQVKPANTYNTILQPQRASRLRDSSPGPKKSPEEILPETLDNDLL